MSFSLSVKREINSNIKQVYESYTNESKLSIWFTTEAKIDLKINGKYHNADGDEGKYIEIIPERRLVFTWDNRNHCPVLLST